MKTTPHTLFLGADPRSALDHLAKLAAAERLGLDARELQAWRSRDPDRDHLAERLEAPLFGPPEPPPELRLTDIERVDRAARWLAAVGEAFGPLEATLARLLQSLGPPHVAAAAALGPDVLSPDHEPARTLLRDTPTLFDGWGSTAAPHLPDWRSAADDLARLWAGGDQAWTWSAAPPTTLGPVLDLVGWARTGPLQAELLHGAALFDAGLDDALAERWALGGLRLTLALADLADQLNDPGLDGELYALDQHLRPGRGALGLIDPADTAELLAGRSLDPDAGWALLHAGPAVERRLYDQHHTRDLHPVTPETVTELYAEGAPTATRQVGVALLLVRPSSGEAELAQLVVEELAAPDAPRPGDARLLELPTERVKLAPDAWGGLLRAYAAATAMMPHRLAGCPFDHLRFTVVLPFAGPAEVDGPSLALPAALALLSLWTGKTVASGLVASGDLSAEGRVASINGARAKARAATRLGRSPLLLPTANAVEIPGGTAVDTLEAAAARAGLLPLPTEPPRLGDAGLLERRIEALVVDAARQNVGPYVVSAPAADTALSPSAMLAGELLWAVGARLSVAPAPPRRLRGRLAEALGAAVVLYTFAADAAGLERARTALADLRAREPEGGRMTDDIELRLDGDALAAAINELGADPEVAIRIAALDQHIADRLADHPDRDTHEARLESTRGRARLHQGRAAEAIPFFERARAAYRREGEGVELARTGVSLAMALRAAGELDRAGEALDQIAADLEAHHGPTASAADQAYGESTQAFWLYERARLDLARGSPAGARTWARLGLQLAERPWPRLGLLRVLAWAERGLGKPNLARDAAAEAALLAEKSQGDFRAIFDRIAEEAKGPYRADGEVY